MNEASPTGAVGVMPVAYPAPDGPNRAGVRRGSVPFLVQHVGWLGANRIARFVRFMDKLNSPVALAVVLGLFLIVDGFLLYRYQQSLRSAGTIVADRPAAVVPEPVAAGKPTTSSKQGPATTGETATAPEAATTGVAAVGEAATLPAGEAEALSTTVVISSHDELLASCSGSVWLRLGAGAAIPTNLEPLGMMLSCPGRSATTDGVLRAPSTG